MNKYELIGTPILSNEWDVYTTDENGNSVLTDSYSVTITMAFHPTDGIAPDFTKSIVSTSTNPQTGTEVNAQRQQEVLDFIAYINA